MPYNPEYYQKNKEKFAAYMRKYRLKLRNEKPLITDEEKLQREKDRAETVEGIEYKITKITRWKGDKEIHPLESPMFGDNSWEHRDHQALIDGKMTHAEVVLVQR